MKKKKTTYPSYTKRVTLSLSKRNEPIFEKVKKQKTHKSISDLMWAAAEHYLLGGK